jgi:hypothetical protein
MTGERGSATSSRKSSRTSGTPKAGFGSLIADFLKTPAGQDLARTGVEALAQALGLNVKVSQPPEAERIRQQAQETVGRFSKWRATEATTSPFKILGVDPSAEQEVVKAAYKAKSKLYHPDKPTGSNQKMKEVNIAYAAICKMKGWPK